MRSTVIELDQIETRMEAFELVQKTCAAGLVGLTAWMLLNAPFALPNLTEEGESNALIARLWVVSQVLMAALFALPLAFLNTRQPWLMALGGLPFIVFAALSLALSARPLGYRLADWSTYPNVQMNLVLILGLVTFLSWMIVFTRGWLGASALLGIPGSAAYRGHHLRTGRRRVLDLIFGVPPVVGFMPRRAASARLLYLVHALLCGLIAFLPFAMSVAIVNFPSVEQQLYYSEELSSYGLGAPDAYRLFWAIVYTATGAALALPVLIWFARRTLALARGTIRVSLQELLAKDERRPILFLRSFHDDQVKLRSARHFISRLISGSSADRNLLDHLVSEELSTVGPVVALGSPSERIPPYGAARGYFEMSSWQDAVRNLMDRAALIVLVLDDTPGTWWEVEQVAPRPDLLAKTIFLTHPEHSASGKSAKLLHRVVELLGHRIASEQPPAATPAARLLGFHVASVGPVWFQSGSFTSRAFGLALRRFSAQVVDAKRPAEQRLIPAVETGTLAEASPPPGHERGTSYVVATLVALSLAAVSTAIVLALRAVNAPDQLLGVSVRPWLASAIVLVPLLLVLGIRQVSSLCLLIVTWVFAGWLSGNLYHSILQMDQVTWDTFDHHAEFAAHAGMFFVMAAVLVYLFELDIARMLRTGAFLAVAGAGLRWGFNTLCLLLLPGSALGSPLMPLLQHFLITWPGLVFVASVLSNVRNGGRNGDQ